MMNLRLIRFTAWSTLLSALMTILGFISLILFFAKGEPWGKINDITSAILALSMIPVLLLLYRLHRYIASTISIIALVIGTIALLIAAFLQVLLVLKVIAFTQTAIVVPAGFSVFGLSLILFGWIALASKSLPPILTYLGILVGLGYLFVILGILINGQSHPISTIGGVVTVICYPLWAIWLGRLLLAGSLALTR